MNKEDRAILNNCQAGKASVKELSDWLKSKIVTNQIKNDKVKKVACCSECAIKPIAKPEIRPAVVLNQVKEKPELKLAVLPDPVEDIELEDKPKRKFYRRKKSED